MLRLARKRGQKVQIGPVTVQIMSCHGGTVGLGITAPKDFAVTRPDAKNQQKKERPGHDGS